MNVKRMWVLLATLLAVVMLSACVAEKANDVEGVPETQMAEVIPTETEVIAEISTEVTEETSEPVEETTVEEMTEDEIAVVVKETTKPTEVVQKTEATEEVLLEESAEEEPTEEVLLEESVEEEPTEWDGQVLNARIGTVQGPSGKETYYNLKMSGVVKIMRKLGYDESEYPYYVREDGVKMLGPYIMCAANLELRPRGTILESSLGTAIVCDTGGFAKRNTTQVDIAVDW